ncbi:MAG: type 1 glutamine amidotransferase [Pseudomonadota bacterium]
MHILIVESEPSELLKKSGQSHAREFGLELQQIESSLEFSIATPYEKPLEGSNLSMIDGVVFPGSGVSWSAHDSKAVPLQKAMESVFEKRLPCFGSCNGLQLASVILGGKVEKRSPELGIARDIKLTETGLVHPMMAGRKSVFSAPTVHGDQVIEMPRGAQLLAFNNHCPVQSFSYNSSGIDFWGVEYHPEISAKNIGKYIRASGDKFPNCDDLVHFLLNAETNSEAASQVGTSIEDMSAKIRTTELRNWLNHVRSNVI